MSEKNAFFGTARADVPQQQQQQSSTAVRFFASSEYEAGATLFILQACNQRTRSLTNWPADNLTEL
jgi:hypothetical protein